MKALDQCHISLNPLSSMIQCGNEQSGSDGGSYRRGFAGAYVENGVAWRVHFEREVAIGRVVVLYNSSAPRQHSNSTAESCADSINDPVAIRWPCL